MTDKPSSSPNSRLKEEVERIPGSITEKAEKTGIPRNTLYDLFRDGNSIKHNYLTLLHEIYDIDINYVLTGSRYRAPSQVREDYAEYLALDDEFTRIPYLRSIRAGAGYGLIEEEAKSHNIAFRRYFVNNTLRSSASDLLALRIGGDSMAPVMVDGDDILIDRARTRIKEGPAFLIRIDEEIFVKFLTKLPGKRVKVWSKNKAFESFEVSLDDVNFEVIGQVVWHAHVSEYL